MSAGAVFAVCCESRVVGVFVTSRERGDAKVVALVVMVALGVMLAELTEVVRSEAVPTAARLAPLYPASTE